MSVSAWLAQFALSPPYHFRLKCYLPFASCDKGGHAPIGYNDHPGDDEAEGEELDPQLLDELARELAGDSEILPDDFEHELHDDEQGQDLLDLDDLHAKFVATAMDRQEETQFCKTDLDKQDARDLEHELGDILLEHYVRQHEPGAADQNQNNAEAASSSGGQTQPQLRQVPLLLDHALLDEALATWSQAMSKSCESLMHMRGDLDGFDVSSADSCLDHQLSLLLHRPVANAEVEINYVSWVQPFKALCGRTIWLDEECNVVYPTHFKPKSTFSDHGGLIMVLPHCGARIRKKAREHVQPVVRRLRTMFEAALNLYDAFDENDIFASQTPCCAGCQKAVVAHATATVPLWRRCSLCLMLWHTDCAKQASGRLEHFQQLHQIPELCHLDSDSDLTVGDLPFIFLSGAEMGWPHIVYNITFLSDAETCKRLT